MPFLCCLALGDAFSPYAEPIFVRCVNIHPPESGAVHGSRQHPTFDSPDKDFLVTSLDLLSAIIQALDNPKAAKLVQSQPTFFELLSFCMEDPTGRGNSSLLLRCLVTMQEICLRSAEA